MIYNTLKTSIDALPVTSLSAKRKLTLQPLVTFIANKHALGEPIRLQFICTHNSRRSIFSQAWAQALALYYRIRSVSCYSGGTETTAVFPAVITTLEQSGFNVHLLAKGENPLYAIKYDDNEAPIMGFSKTYDHAFNPSKDFAAILTCSSADNGCPFIAGAERRIPITFEDPKRFDTTQQKDAQYLETSLCIATELCYVFAAVSESN